ncbi:GntR family transcriptional regulator [Paenibacillus hemerocallicola]|jgi:DNA-binding LacI/PurR family transcriptional regulator|uniref:GntR family transcriptional regulator n=1 Tax=Paenibacillus hemerocallicola TaxID=1172614 RepID=A0A5C4T2L3_9BACL|nr:GntR family transcriptional regulator [Paenibacillus hemerocallicola]TNJ63301.1 GntR family transcriptional regulator [Paenibacillus hemerocallicola]
MSKEEKFVPLYKTIYTDLRQQILRGELTSHTPLPLQGEIAKQYNTSEITSRRALTELAKDRLIYRVKGKGSFVMEQAGKIREHADATPMDKVYFIHPRANSHIFNHRFFSDMLEGIHDCCERNDIAFSISEADDHLRLPDDRNAGFIVLTHVPNAREFGLETLSRWIEERHKLVTVHFYYPHLRLPYVISDNLTGGYLSTQHLLALGHERIGIILTGKTQLELNQEFSLRLQGYKLALNQHRIPLDPELVVTMDGQQETEEMGHAGFSRLMALEQPPTAVFATSDMKAIGVLRAAQDMGIDVPGQMSVVGYDNLTVSPYLSPPLTTIDQNARQLGIRAVELLLLEQADDQGSLVKDEIVPRLIVRGSTAAPQTRR